MNFHVGKKMLTCLQIPAHRSLLTLIGSQNSNPDVLIREE